MKKIIINSTGFLLIMVGILLSGAVHAGTLMLKRDVAVNDTVVRLGDIFENAGRKGAIVVAPAPALGRKATYDSTWLSTVARANGFDWKPRSIFENVTVKRSTRTYDTSEIEAALMKAVAKKIKNRRFEVELDNRAMKIHAPIQSTSQIKITRLSTNLNSERFEATLVLPNETNQRSITQRISGRIHEIVDVPVLADQVKPGEIIQEGNLDWISMRRSALQRNTLIETGKIVGMSLKRWHRTGTSLRSSDLGRPIVVPKGASVLMVLSTPMMTITTQGQSVEDGSMGDVIRVMNTTSKMVVDAIVEAPGRVKVTSGSHEARQSQQAWAQ